MLFLLLPLLPSRGERKKSTPTTTNTNYGMRNVYAFAFAAAAVIHIGTTIAHLPRVVEMYSPSFDPLVGPPGMEVLLKWDYMIISATLVAWVLMLGRWGVEGVCRALVGVLVVGPAAVVAGGLWALEGGMGDGQTT